MWSQPQANPASLVHNAIRACLDELQTPGSGILQKLKRVSGIDVGAVGFKFGFKLEALGKPDGVSLAQAFLELIAQAKADVVLIVDEVQHALGSVEGGDMLHALKATRDAINTRPQTPGYFLFVGTGSHRARVQELSIKGNQAFNGAVTHDFPVLGMDFVEYVLKQVQPQLGDKGPSVAVAGEAFQRMGSRPEELMKALNILRGLPAGANPDEHLPTIAQTLGAAAADVEIQKIEAFGPLAEAIFTRICSNVKGVFTADALKEYSSQIGRDVSTQEVQSTIGLLTSDNLIMRLGHGHYGATDTFVEQAWRGRSGGLLQPAAPSRRTTDT